MFKSKAEAATAPQGASVFDALPADNQPSRGFRTEEECRLAGSLLRWLEQHVDEGGFAGLETRFAKSGLSPMFNALVKSAPGSDAFIDVLLEASGNEMEAVLGKDTVKQMAQECRVAPEQASLMLQESMASIISHFTPRNEVPSNAVLKMGFRSLRRNMR